jgi:hypothetical protein
VSFDRIPCEVPFCRRTASKEKFPGEGVRIICGRCWRLGDQRPRRAYRAAMRKLKRFGSNDRWERIAHNSWERIRRQAIERAAGITG